MHSEVKEFQALVSVICPTYNESGFFELAYKSIVSQTYPDIEFIIIDSSTNDYVRNVIDLSDGRIRYYWREKRGIADALNYGIEQARGSFIARMDADDISMEERIEKQVAFLNEHPDIMMVGTQGINIDQNGKVCGFSACPINDGDIKAGLLFSNSFYHPTVMFRRLVFDENMRYDSGFMAEDYDLWTRLALKYTLANLSERLIYYRIHGENASLRLHHEVSMSASRSAIRYIENFFGLNLANYDIDDVCKFKTEFEHYHNPARYIARQIGLMYEIWDANFKKKLINETSLLKVLNQRWRWALTILGAIENINKYSRINFDISTVESDSEELFLHALSRKYDCELKDISISIRNDLEVLVQDYQKFLREKKNIVVYGLGRRGRRFLEQLHEKRERGECGWELAAVSDKRIEGIEFENIFYQTTDISELNRTVADYIVISPRDYGQIAIELSGYGIAESRMLTANMLI